MRQRPKELEGLNAIDMAELEAEARRYDALMRRKWTYRMWIERTADEALRRVIHFELGRAYRLDDIAAGLGDVLAGVIFDTAPAMTNTEIEGLVSRMAASIAIKVVELRREKADGRFQA